MNIRSHQLATIAYLATPCGSASFRESQERFGYSYQRALAVAVIEATGLRVYERISAVVEALLAQEVTS